MINLGHPGDTADGMMRLYEAVIVADTELKKIMKELPVFYRRDDVLGECLPPFIEHQRRCTLIFMSHKAGPV